MDLTGEVSEMKAKKFTLKVSKNNITYNKS
jgi:hypothetical protein